MAYAESQPVVSLVAETTFANTDIGKFLQMSSANARVSIVESTAPSFVVGILLSETYSTSTGANESVSVGLLSGIGQVYMAGSTLAAGAPIACSTNGFGVLALGSTNDIQLGYIVDGSSGTTGRLHSVLFQPRADI
jgi:hypothetical protein